MHEKSRHRLACGPANMGSLNIPLYSSHRMHWCACSSVSYHLHLPSGTFSHDKAHLKLVLSAIFTTGKNFGFLVSLDKETPTEGVYSYLEYTPFCRGFFVSYEKQIVFFESWAPLRREKESGRVAPPKYAPLTLKLCVLSVVDFAIWDEFIQQSLTLSWLYKEKEQWILSKDYETIEVQYLYW